MEDSNIEGAEAQTPEPTLAEETWDKDTPTVDKVRIERDRARKELQATQAKLKEYETEKVRIEQEKAKSEGNLTKYLEMKEKELADATKQLQELHQAEAKRVQQDRENALLESVASNTGVQDRRMLRALMREASQDGLFELAPDSMDDIYVKRVIGALEKTFPGALNKPSGPTAVPGTNTQRLPLHELPTESERERVTKLAQSFGPQGGAARPWLQGK